jgi:prepilin-type N-terminal cleavage/methylation domain-containing protein
MGKSKRSFTLLEVLVSIAILTLVVAGVFSVFYVGDTCWRTDTGLVDLQQQVRQAIDGMSREIRQGNPGSIAITEAGARIDFSIGGDNIAYYLNNGQIIREYSAGADRILGNNISALNFSLDGSVVLIEVTAEKTVQGRDVTFALSEKVGLRNG